MKAIAICVVVLGILSAGCVTTENAGPSEELIESARMQSDLRAMREDISRINGRLEEIEVQHKELGVEVRRLHDSKSMENESVTKKFDALESQIRAVDAARVADKQDTIDKLSRTIADIINKHALSGGSSPSGGTGRGVRGGGSTAGGTSHVVMEKETLSVIAQQYGVSVEAMVQANGLKNANNIRVGQRLAVPR